MLHLHRSLDAGNKTPPTSASDRKDEEVTAGLAVWRRAIDAITNPAQLYMCLQLLDQCVAWEKSIMKVVRIDCHLLTFLFVVHVVS